MLKNVGMLKCRRFSCDIQIDCSKCGTLVAMIQRLLRRRVLVEATCVTALVIGLKLLLNHVLHFEPIEQSSLHNALISSAIFVMSFLLSSTISDYKESERIPAQFASTVDDMFHDAKQIHRAYPKFDLEKFRLGLIEIVKQFRAGTRKDRKVLRKEITDLHLSFYDMEKAGVPPNFITKLKQQTATLSANLFRVNYIQKINFLPSALLLGRLIVGLVVTILVLTDHGTSVGEIAITGGITFIMTYILRLIYVARIPFGSKGSSQDDVSLFLLREVRDYLTNEGKSAKK